MLAVLSPAKSLDTVSPLPPVEASQPRFLDEAARLAKAAARLSAPQLRKLMHISEPLAALNVARFKAFATPFTADNARPALYTFDGDVYAGLDAASLDAEAVAFAQGHLRILSGLYGVLRPLDLMQPYRLEMGTSFGIGKAETLYAVWGKRIATALAQDMADHADKTLVNLASSEYFRAVDTNALPGRVLTIDFRDERGSTLRFNSFVAKKCRGAMARLICEQRLESPAALQQATVFGHRFDANRSSADHWLFVRQVD